LLLARAADEGLPSATLARQGLKEPPQEYLSAEWQVSQRLEISTRPILFNSQHPTS
jgi:hypothetical protein